MNIAAGTKLGRYEIRSKIGKGGMGEVYLAQDTTVLERAVAIKVLPAEVASDPKRMQRFVQEAKTVSALNHPNILTIYEFGQEGATRFIATEFIEGENLRQRMSGARMKLSDVLTVAIQTADALAAAHEAGIIHRDIKLENIMLRRRDAYVKVLDFGLAKLIEQRPATTDGEAPTKALFNTEEGIVVGTVIYMSPEQARGLPVDARTDIFSLGVVLYEMVAGCLPFEGSTKSDILAAIISEKEPPPLARFARDVPAELERIVEKALRKDREERYQSAKDMLLDLKRLKHKLGVDAEIERTVPPEFRAGKTSSQIQSALATASGPAQETAQAGTANASSAQTIVSGIKAHKLAGAVILAILTVATVAFFVFRNRGPALTEKDTILIADFTNTTGDAVFDGTLKQALAVHLRQSPFWNIFADGRVRETLALMNRSPDERVTPVIGREICQRQGLKALLTGSIASFGRNYVINLEAVNAQTGEVLASEQSEAEGKEQVLRSLGEAATRLREKLGESLSSIQKFSLEQVTTSSLEALKAYTLGVEQNLKGKFFESIPSLKHAIELDPNFASAYSMLAANYTSTNQPGLAADAARKAFELRGRVSEREKLLIADQYYSKETGELDKAIEALELLVQTYPRDQDARHNLGYRYSLIGQHEKAIEEYREALRLNPSLGITRTNLALSLMRLNRFEEARAMGEQVIAQKFDSVSIHRYLYHLAFIRGDTAAMQQQVDWADGRPGEYDHLNWQAGTTAFAGQWQKARELSNRAAELAEQRKLEEEAGNSVSSNAEWAAVLGQCQQLRAEIARAAALPRTPLSFFRTGIALALCGDAAQAQAQNDEAVKRYPKNTLVNEVYSPLIRAAIDLQRGNRTQAIQMLQAVSRYEGVSFYYQNYLRGQAYLGEGKGAEAAREFQTILDHRGWSPLSPLYPLAHLGLARAATLAGDMAKSRKAYQDFFALWKDADTDIPILIEAKKEYEKLT
jgi:serine/threonine protein kinase/tetratricopeptide (TPR) repeat protein